MDFEAWHVDVPAGTAAHSTGFVIVVEGDPANPMGVTPGRFPEGLSAVQQATLLRCGIEALAKAAIAQRQRRPAAKLNAVESPKSGIDTGKVRTPRSRPVLSLKR